MTAYHEAGHAVVAYYLENSDPVYEISIIPRGMAGGYTLYRPDEDSSFTSKTEMLERIISMIINDSIKRYDIQFTDKKEEGE